MNLFDVIKPKNEDEVDDYDDVAEINTKKKIKFYIAISSIVIVILLMIIFIGLTKKKTTENATSPIAEFTGTNDNEYDLYEQISIDDYNFKLIHENGYEEVPSKDDITLSQEYVNRIGATTTITASIEIDDEIYTCDIVVKATRGEIESFECGFPTLSDVRAVIYSNGELCFEGQGNIVTYVNNHYPWLNDRTDENTQIKSITFEDTVKPICLDNYFCNMETLEYVGRIPDSVVTMTGTFSNCTNLKNGANWTQCKNLTNINDCYSGCSSLAYCPAIPQYVRTANNTFSGCTSLTVSPDFEYAVSITDAVNTFEGCISLQEVNIPPCALNITSMYSGCINLHQMPEIPDFVINMSNTFSGCLNLEYLTTIPYSVENVSGCFSGCKFLKGELTINSNPYGYSNFLMGTAESVDLNLVGDSLMLDVLANTGSGYITVNGNPADSSITERDQVIFEEY